VLRGSSDRRKVFLEICRGKKKFKTPDGIASTIKRPRMRVLQEALILSNEDIIKKERIKGIGLVYKKYPFYCQHKKKIIRLALNKKKLEKYPTSYSTATTRGLSVNVTIPKTMFNVEQVTIDDIDSFAKVNGTRPPKGKNLPLGEKWFKEGLKKVIGEGGTFQDWGGEKNDLFSTRLRFKGRRVNVAFGLKGKATRQPLLPNKMGKRGDQIQRLMGSQAEVFLVQFWGQIDESVIEQMRTYAKVRSYSEIPKRIYYGVIDGDDTRRIIAAYRERFR
jgi:hypothetical protein